MIPKSVKIAGIVYQVRLVTNLLDNDERVKLNGCIKYGISEIQIEKKLSDQVKQVTLWHEVIHGILSQAEIEHDEKLVEVLGYGICGFIQDNPGVIT
jgi:hypothetical protein